VKILVAALRSLHRWRVAPVSISAKFGRFRAIGMANDAFLSDVASLSDQHHRGGTLAMSAVASAYESLSASIGNMVKELVAMGGGRYQDLLPRYEAIEREIEREVDRKSVV
jgi:hypothetical protein